MRRHLRSLQLRTREVYLVGSAQVKAVEGYISQIKERNWIYRLAIYRVERLNPQGNLTRQ